MFKKIIICLGIPLLLIIGSCDTSNQKTIKTVNVNFSNDQTPGDQLSGTDTIPTINVAVSAIISPRETFKYYKELFDFISRKTGYKIVFKQRKTYQEVNLMLRESQVDVAFVCSGAYVKEKDVSDIELLVVPVCNGQPYYNAYVIVNKDLNITTFPQLRGHSFAYTDPLSNTGKFYIDKRLSQLNEISSSFFSKTVFTHAHDISMQLVSNKIIDGASVDGLIFEYLAQKYPQRVENLRVIEKSESFGIPPVVVPKNIDPILRKRLKDIFLNMHEIPEGKKILQKIMIDRFIEGNDDSYNSIRRMLAEYER